MLDSLDPQVHPTGRRTTSIPAVELVRGDVRDRAARRRRARRASTPSSTSPPPSASASRCTRSSATSRSTPSAARRCWRRSSPAAIACGGCSWRRQHVDLRRGPVRRPAAAAATVSRPACGPRSSSRAQQWDVLDDDGRPLVPEPTAETKPLRPTSVYAITKRDHEEMCLSVGARLRHPDRGAALLQRLRLRARRSRTRTPASPRSSPRACCNGRAPLIFEDGEQSPRLRRRPRHRPRALARAGVPRTPSATRSTSAPASRPRCARSRRRSPAASASTSRPSCPASSAPATSAPATPTPSSPRACSGFRAEIPFERGMADLLGWLDGRTADDRVDEARAALADRGLAR